MTATIYSTLQVDIWMILVEHIHLGRERLDSVLLPAGYKAADEIVMEKDTLYVRADVLEHGWANVTRSTTVTDDNTMVTSPMPMPTPSH